MAQTNFKLIVKKIKIEEGKESQTFDFQELQQLVPENHRLVSDSIRYHVFADEIVLTFEVFPVQK